MLDVLGVSAAPAALPQWMRLVSELGIEPVAVPLMGAPDHPVDRWLVVLDDRIPSTYRFWLRSLRAPIALVSPSLNASAPLLNRVPLIRVLCHTSRALPALGDVLSMTKSITDGALILGPALPRVDRGVRRGVTYAC
jgi:hypothetical protein